MGQGTITGGGEDGSYTLALDYGRTRRDGLKAQYEARIAKLQEKLPELEAKRGSADAEIATARALEDSAIRLYIEAVRVEAPPAIIDPLFKNVNDARRRVLFAESAKLSIETPIEGVKAEIKGLQLQIDGLLSGEISETQQAWCVDLTEDGAGPVGTIEVPGEPATVLICPGCRGPQQSDGYLLARQVMTPSQVFFNAAILPGWQKFKPTYRIGTITAVDMTADKASVNLEAATSSAQGLDVNQTTTLTNIPVVYMTCNAGAFDVGDRVVVEFVGQVWDGARVIGFASNPKSCQWPVVYARDFYMHVFECTDLETLAEVAVTSGISVDYRLNRGGWQSMEFIQTISASGGRLFQQYGDPSPSLFDRPIVEIGYNIPLSSGDPSAPKVNGLSFWPANTNDGGSETIVELRIMRAGKVKVNCAFRWTPQRLTPPFLTPTYTEVVAQGGIRPKAGGSTVTVLEIRRLEGYDLFIKTGD